MGKFLLPFIEGRKAEGTFSPVSIFLSTFIMAIFLTIQTEILILFGLIGLVIVVGTLVGTRWRTILSLASKFEVVILFWVVILPFSFGHTVIFAIPSPWGSIFAYSEGLNLGLLIGLRIFGIVTLFLAALSHMSLGEFIGALKTLRIPTAILGSLLIMLRYIPLFLEERNRLQEAQQLRGFHKGARSERIKSLGSLVGSIIDRAMDRSVAVYESMTLRGFGHGMFIIGVGPRRKDALLFLGLSILFIVLFHQQILGVLFK